MITKEYINQLNQKISILNSGKAVAIAAQDTHVKMSERIFEKGETSQGNKLAYNKTDPLYVNPENSPNNTGNKGKNGDTKFKNGKPHKTGYFDSYKSYKDKLGQESSFMNLTLWGTLKNDFQKGVVKVSDFKYIATVRDENAGKVEKFSPYFKASKEEHENFKETLHFEIMQILK